MKNKKLIILIVVFVLVLGLAYGLYHVLGDNFQVDQMATEPSQDADSGQELKTPPAPDFTVKDIDGNLVHLSDFLGKKPIVLNFWASWCGPCRSEMADFNEAYLELKDEVQFLMINITDGSRETVEIASEFVEKNGFEFPVFYDVQSDAAQTYGAYALPTTFFINIDSQVVAHAQGAISRKILQKGIDMISPQE